MTADRRTLPYNEIGDNHLIKILQLIEANLSLYGSECPSQMLPKGHIEQYDDLVIEAVRRGLFTWSTERKYLAKTSERIRKGI